MKKWLTMILALALALVAVSAAAETEEPVSDIPLPAYAYTGDDPVEAAVIAYMQESGIMDGYWLAEGGVCVPTPVIVYEREADDTHETVYGNFWTFCYVLQGDVLVCNSGGELPGVMQLEAQGDGWKVVSAEFAGDGEDYDRDIKRFADGDDDLLEAMYGAADGDGEPLKNARRVTLEAYVTANGLSVAAYQDPYWEPVGLFGKVYPPIQEEKQRALLEANREQWAFDAYAEPWFYAFTDLDHNGRLEVIAASTQGSGMYTYGHLWEVNAAGTAITDCFADTPVVEGPDDWPEIVRDELPCIYEPMLEMYFYPCEDVMRDGAARAIYTLKALCLYEGGAAWTTLASKTVEFTDDGGETVTAEDSRGDAISAEEYEQLRKECFEDFPTETLKLDWIKVGD